LSWIAVLFRLWVRIKVIREPGLDDAFVLLAAVGDLAKTFLRIRSLT
jgi:hypothetical protein